jgi:hypothetical protein
MGGTAVEAEIEGSVALRMQRYAMIALMLLKLADKSNVLTMHFKHGLNRA